MRSAAVDNFILVRGSDTSLVFYFIFLTFQYWVKCAVMVGAMLGDGWHNVGFWLAQCWVMIGATQACCWLMVGATLASGWHNVGVWLVQCWLIVVQRWLIIVGETLAYTNTNKNTNTNKFIIRNQAHTCMRAGTNVKQVINMNVHYKTKKKSY